MTAAIERLLQLEMELRQMGADGSLSADAYHKRLSEVQELKERLGETDSHWALDLPQDCSPEQEGLCRNFLNRYEKRCLSLLALIRKVTGVLHSSSAGFVFSIQGLFALAKLRRCLLGLQANRRTLSLRQHKHSLLELKQRFHEGANLQKRILELQAQYRAGAKDLTLLKHQVTFQEEGYRYPKERK